MTAYVIADINVHDQETYREYGALVPDTLKPHGGRFIVRGGASETLEGDWQPRRLVVIEFPSADDARRWHGVAGVRPGAGHAPALRHGQPRAGRGGARRDLRLPPHDRAQRSAGRGRGGAVVAQRMA